MKQQQDMQKRARAERVYAWFLRLYPRAHRQAFGNQMRQAFQDHYCDAVETEGEQTARFWLGVVGDEGKSLLREHIAALREGSIVMKALKQALLVGLPIALVYSLTWVFNDPVGRLQGALLFPCTIVLLLLLASFLRTVSPSGIGRSWVRIGLVSGGIMALYFTVLNILYAVVPVPQGSNDFLFNEGSVWDLSLPLLGGVVGVLGGYAGGKIRTGLAACLLAGGIGALGYAASQGLLIALLWNALTHHLLQSNLQGGYLGAIQFYSQVYGQPVTLWHFLLYGSNEDMDSGVMAYLSNGVYSLFIEGVFAVSGAVLGAAVSYRANDALHQEAVPAARSNRVWLLTRPIGATLLSLVLVLLTWAGLAAGSDGIPLSLSVLGGFFMGPAFVLWLLGFLVVLAFVLVSVRPSSALPEASAPSR